MTAAAPEDRRDAGPTVLVTAPMTRGAKWGLAVMVVILAALLVPLLSTGRALPGYLNFLPATAFLVVYVVLLARPPRIELRDTEMLVRYLRTTRIPYADVVAVDGDIPGRLSWSEKLVVERQAGRRVALPRVEASLPEVHEIITARLEREQEQKQSTPE